MHFDGIACKRIKWKTMQELRQMGTEIILGCVHELLPSMSVVQQAAKLMTKTIPFKFNYNNYTLINSNNDPTDIEAIYDEFAKATVNNIQVFK